MTASTSTTALCTYRVKQGKEEEFLGLLRRHWPTLRRAGLVTDTPAVAYRGTDEQDGTYFVEIFTWKDAASVDAAHNSPEVLAVWEPMGALCEARGGRPPMEFPHVEPVDLGAA